MTRKELLEYTRAEKLDKLFLLVSQMDTLAFESVEQLESLMSQKLELERELNKIDEGLAKLDQENWSCFTYMIRTVFSLKNCCALN